MAFLKVLMAALFGCSACSSASPAAPFAISCIGKAKFVDKAPGKKSERAYDLPPQVYVFDESLKRVQLALEPRQEFEDVCIRGGYIDSTSFSPGLISVRSEKADYMCDFQVNRKMGEAVFFSHSDFPGKRSNEIEFKMTCSPSAIPVFDPSKNKF